MLLVNTMANTLRMFEAKNFENTQFDKLVSFVHDVFHKPFHSAIGNSFAAFAGAAFMLMIAVQTSDTLSYMSSLAHY